MPKRQQRASAQTPGGEAVQRKTSTGSSTLRSEPPASQHGKSGIRQVHESSEIQRESGHSKHATLGGGGGNGPTRFPKLEECAHFHYDIVEFGPLQVALCEAERENYGRKEAEKGDGATTLVVRVSCGGRAWTVRRSLAHFCSLDTQLHRCIFDRKFSQLCDLTAATADHLTLGKELEQDLQVYLSRLSELAGPMVNCGSVLNWLEMDNRGNRLVALDHSGINTPAIAAAHAVKGYTAHAADEISLQVGDIVSLIDMPSREETKWWRGKHGFEVGFFPSDCVEVIGDKLPPSMGPPTVVPVPTQAPPPPPSPPATAATTTTTTTTGGSSPGSSGTVPPPAGPLITPAAARKPCEPAESAEDSVSMVRKHGKLMSFLRTFFSTRPPRNQLKQSGIVKERVFGCDLGEHLLNSGHDVPVVLKCCTEVIERYGIVDGIYRLSGVTSNIQKLRVAFDEDETPDLTESVPFLQDIHSISSLLKMYFRELPNPLLTYQLYHQFAEAVKDEENRLLRIYDVVQQLPPPHYRTLAYLMRHLGRVSSQSSQTGMHSKNLAIVWAPNLLRSKELEQGGGAAALQGVGVQAVVTECLICYCDFIFTTDSNNDQSHRPDKRARPRSLAVASPTRLLTLQEARERAMTSSMAAAPQHRFIHLGGGGGGIGGGGGCVLGAGGGGGVVGVGSSATLPAPSVSGGSSATAGGAANYHTVIELPSHRKKTSKDSGKGKKSPNTGWKSLFSKPRAASVRKTRKGSAQDEEKSLQSLPTRALPNNDADGAAPTWTRRLRSAKSAESLVSPTSSTAGSITDHLSTASFRGREEVRTPAHKRSLSSDGSGLRRPTSPGLESLTSPSFDGSERKVTDKPQEPSSPGSHKSRRSTTTSERNSRSRQSFVRGDSTRKALHAHRRTPSAPNTPSRSTDHPRDARQQPPSAEGEGGMRRQKATSQPHLDRMVMSSDDWGRPRSPVSTLDADGLGVDIDAAVRRARLRGGGSVGGGGEDDDVGTSHQGVLQSPGALPSPLLLLPPRWCCPLRARRTE